MGQIPSHSEENARCLHQDEGVSCLLSRAHFQLGRFCLWFVAEFRISHCTVLAG